MSQQTTRPVVGGGNGLKHGLPMPVRGQVQGRFGVDRPDGGVWRGVVLRAPEGTPVKSRPATPNGCVVLATSSLWIMGSNICGLSSLAGGRSGVALVGATGGQVESGLYFEIRHRGAPVDPAQWLAQ